MFCVNCGAEIEDTHKFCAFCGTAVYNPNKKTIVKAEKEKKQTGNWPVALFEDVENDEGFFAYDIATESETDFFSTKEAALNDLEREINKWLYTVEKVPDEKSVKGNSYVKELISDGYKLIEIIYLNVNFEDEEDF